jgi:hypothetical protein
LEQRRYIVIILTKPIVQFDDSALLAVEAVPVEVEITLFLFIFRRCRYGCEHQDRIIGIMCVYDYSFILKPAPSPVRASRVSGELDQIACDVVGLGRRARSGLASTAKKNGETHQHLVSA